MNDYTMMSNFRTFTFRPKDSNEPYLSFCEGRLNDYFISQWEDGKTITNGTLHFSKKALIEFYKRLTIVIQEIDAQEEESKRLFKIGNRVRFVSKDADKRVVLGKIGFIVGYLTNRNSELLYNVSISLNSPFQSHFTCAENEIEHYTEETNID